jgi:sialic acid synthase SpsE
MEALRISAEIGSNFCGSYDLAMAHIHAAKNAGATDIKFQLFRAATLDSRAYMQEQLVKYELPLEWVPMLSKEVRQYGLNFGLSVFAPDLVEPCRGQLDFVKIAAFDLPYDDLLRAAASLDVPVMLSTGMATMDEIDHALGVVGRDDTIVLQCVSAYPAKPEDYNLLAVSWYQNWGVSDHSPGWLVPMLTVAMGGMYIEKHFRLGRVTSSPDAPHSMPPNQFARMVAQLHRVEQVIGTGYKTGPLPCEMPLFETCRRSNSKTLRGNNG